MKPEALFVPVLAAPLMVWGCAGDARQGDPSCHDAFYADVDDDGYGDPAVSRAACTAPDGYAAAGNDCDDANSGVHPDAVETCNGIDDDCDLVVDDDAVNTPTWYVDADADGYGAAETAVATCAPPDGFSATNDDCDDANAGTHPNAVELCDALDNDCDAVPDDGLPDGPWYRDADGDGHGDPSISVTEGCAPPDGYVATADDCDDVHVHAYDGAPQSRTDGVDDGCDGVTSITPTADLPLWRAAGTQYGDLGVSIATGGDFNGDGHPDLVLGGTSYEVGASWVSGKVVIFSGPFEATDAPADDGDAAAILYGRSNDAESMVFSPGDLDGDGADDLLVCDPWSVYPAVGHVYVMRGTVTGLIDLTVDTQVYAASAEWDYLGICAAPGDLDGDDLPDVVIGAPGKANGGVQRGAVYAMSGPVAEASVEDAGQVLEGTLDGENIGHGVMALGDIDGDGLRDFSVTNAFDISGSPDGFAAYLITDHSAGAYHPRDVGVTVYDDAGPTYGFIVNRLDDIDGDGYGDLAFGSEHFESEELAVLQGPFGSETDLPLEDTSETSFYSSDTTADPMLAWATPLGDWNGDGSGTLAFGDPGLRSTASLGYSCGAGGIVCMQGGIYLLAQPVAPGAHDLGTEADRIEGDYARGFLGGGLGPGLQGGTDYNSDGTPDLAFTAYGATVGGVTESGEAYILFGGGTP